MKKKNKIIIISIIVICLTCFTATKVNAYDWASLENQMNGVMSPTANSKFKNIFSIVINLMRYAGTAIAVLMVVITGIQYMMASAQDKADYKKKLIPMAIGAVLLFSATQIIAIVGNIAINALEIQ